MTLLSLAVPECGQTRQRVPAQVYAQDPGQCADDQQALRVLVPIEQVAAAPGNPEQHGEADRKDQAVERAGEDQQGRWGLSQEHEDDAADQDERHGDQVAGALRGGALGDEGNRGVGGADDAGQCSGPEDHAEGADADWSCSVAERFSGFVVAGQCDTAGDDAEDRQEQQHSHDTGDDDRQGGDVGNRFDVLDAGGTRIDHAVRAGVGDVAADGAADQGGDDQEVDLLWQHHVADRISYRRRGDNRYIEHQQDHDGTEHHNDAVQCHSGLLGEEDQDCHDGGDRATDLGIQSEHGVQAKAGTGDVADIEDHAANEHERGQYPADAGQDLVAQFLGAHAADADDAPDVELDSDVHEDGDHDGEGKGRADLYRELGSLGDEAGADGAGSHQEHGT